MYTLIQTAMLNGVDPQAWLADVLDRIADQPHHRPSRVAPLELENVPRALTR
jgi:transposase